MAPARRLNPVAQRTRRCWPCQGLSATFPVMKDGARYGRAATNAIGLCGYAVIPTARHIQRKLESNGNSRCRLVRQSPRTIVCKSDAK